MKKSELKTGYVVRLRNGNDYVVYRGVSIMYNGNHYTDVLVRVVGDESSWFSLTDFGDDLLCNEFSEWDIVKVFNITHAYTLQNVKYNSNLDNDLLWSRVEPKEMTLAEIEMALGYPIKIVKEE